MITPILQLRNWNTEKESELPNITRLGLKFRHSHVNTIWVKSWKIFRIFIRNNNFQKDNFQEWKFTNNKSREAGELESSREATHDPAKSRPLNINTRVETFMYFVTVVKLLEALAIYKWRIIRLNKIVHVKGCTLSGTWWVPSKLKLFGTNGWIASFDPSMSC